MISTDPAAGERVLDGGEVTSSSRWARRSTQLPKLTGITEDEAQDRIQNANMAFGKSTKEFSETVPEGIVIASDPKGGTTLRPGTIVDLVVSKGRRPIPVGSWAGKRADDAERVLEQRGLKVERLPAVLRHASPRASSSPRTRRPAPSSRATPSTLLVSLGPELVEVPNVVAYGVDDATAALQAAGFEVVVQEARGLPRPGLRLLEDPEAGTELPIGSTVTLYLV